MVGYSIVPRKISIKYFSSIYKYSVNTKDRVCIGFKRRNWKQNSNVEDSHVRPLYLR
jgi:hypothetical protein